MKRTDEDATKHIFCYSKLPFLAITNLFLSFLGLRLIHVSHTGFNSFLSSYMFILAVVLSQEVTVFILQITVFFFCCV